MPTEIITIAQSNVTTFWGILLYWVPLLFCAFGYIVRTFQDVQTDIAARAAAEAKAEGELSVYIPQVTIGTLIGRGIATILPVVNLFCSLFDVGPKIFGQFFRTLGQIFDQPLVPKRKK